ncbi:hypothetical protein CEXT_519461 [Caerostris extrusa]|uniref:Uncharacterized protein n=1 Tax=Caerostris extrusa TaxID=172846 RepID=A0AAV4T912_CAEEX|nr:hypothetical protein CEXT_519461 [Caerostris extrusa]
MLSEEEEEDSGFHLSYIFTVGMGGRFLGYHSKNGCYRSATSKHRLPSHAERTRKERVMLKTLNCLLPPNIVL